MKQHFPLLANRNITYLDSAAMTQKPKIVIDAITKYYSEENANIHRGLYELSIQATQKYEDARETVARFIGAQSSEIIFTKSTTESLNALAHMLPPLFAGRKDIILTELEHHSNIVPWQELAKRNGLTIKYIRITPDGELDYAHAAELITSNTALVSITHVSQAPRTSIYPKPHTYYFNGVTWRPRHCKSIILRTIRTLNCLGACCCICIRFCFGILNKNQ